MFRQYPLQQYPKARNEWQGDTLPAIALELDDEVQINFPRTLNTNPSTPNHLGFECLPEEPKYLERYA